MLLASVQFVPEGVVDTGVVVGINAQYITGVNEALISNVPVEFRQVHPVRLTV